MKADGVKHLQGPYRRNDAVVYVNYALSFKLFRKNVGHIKVHFYLPLPITQRGFSKMLLESMFY